MEGGHHLLGMRQLVIDVARLAGRPGDKLNALRFKARLYLRHYLYQAEGAGASDQHFRLLGKRRLSHKPSICVASNN